MSIRPHHQPVDPPYTPAPGQWWRCRHGRDTVSPTICERYHGAGDRPDIHPGDKVFAGYWQPVKAIAHTASGWTATIDFGSGWLTYTNLRQVELVDCPHDSDVQETLW